ncbi:MAG: phosphatase PAP2 family protein [Polyangiaceae bacterium]|nr:phosphatase PAP2 family protein [Polyangiaceae bacterium]
MRARRVAMGWAFALAALGAAPARAQSADAPPRPRVWWVADSIVTGTGVALALGASLLPVNASGRWQSEPLPFDTGYRGRSSSSADSLSDSSGAVAIVIPAALQVGQGFDAATGERLFIYAETLSVTLGINAVAKVLVGRPRPYFYSSDPRVARFSARQGKETHLSFYSGHSALTFAAGVSGSLLFTQTSNDRAARATVWGTELFLAGLTAGLRVRAGQHFPTDVLVGILVGTGVGVAGPYIHYRRRGMRGLCLAEAVAAGAAPVAGLVTSALLPFDDDVSVRLEPPIASPRSPRWALVPWASPYGLGVAGVGRF